MSAHPENTGKCTMYARSAAGFGLGELVIVMAIVGIIVAIAVPSMLGTKDTAYKRSALAVGATYLDAIESFKLNHGDRTPSLCDAVDVSSCDQSDWPSATAEERRRGPLGRDDKPYLSLGIPEPISDGAIDIGTEADVTAGRLSGKHGRIVYKAFDSYWDPGYGFEPVKKASTNFVLRIEMQKEGQWSYYCSYTNTSSAVLAAEGEAEFVQCQG